MCHILCVAGSPFKVRIGGEPSERITERIMRHRDAVEVTHVGSECELSLKIPGECTELVHDSCTSYLLYGSKRQYV